MQLSEDRGKGKKKKAGRAIKKFTGGSWEEERAYRGVEKPSGLEHPIKIIIVKTIKKKAERFTYKVTRLELREKYHSLW